jgi:phytoene synthase
MSRSPDLEASYAFCRATARSRARNFYYSFVLLPRPQRDAMCAMYAFMRFCDDLSDDQGGSLAKIETWRTEMHRALRGDYAGHPVWPAFHDAALRYSIPHRYFEEMIEGVRSDLPSSAPRRVDTFEDLYRYCYQVASVVGLTTIHIFGFQDPRAPLLAEKCGIAFQLTNILRDIREDLDNGRIYLPAEDMARFQVVNFEYGANFAALMRFEAERAEAYYSESRELIGMVDRRSRMSLWALTEIYRRLLKKIEKSGFRVLDRRIRLSAPEKLSIVVQAWVRGLL